MTMLIFVGAKNVGLNQIGFMNREERLQIAMDALMAIATVKTVGYKEARKARKTAQDALIKIAELETEITK